MWSNNLSTFIWCVVLITSALALPTAKKDESSDVMKPEPIILEAIELPSDEKPAEKPAEKPSEQLLDEKPAIEVKPTEETKPNAESMGPVQTIIEQIPLGLTPPRRQFLYDQRQDGKYNIRADLENFVILVVPSSGHSLLDFLKRSNQRPQHHNKRTHHKQHHKKYYAGSTTTAAGKPLDVNNNNVPIKKSASRLDYLRPEPADLIDSPIGGEFIEGRTPYHVDISSSEILQPAFGDLRSLHSDGASIADLPLQTESNVDSTVDDSTILLTTIKGKQLNAPINSNPSSTQPIFSTINTNIYPRSRKSITIDGYGNSFTNHNSVLLTRKSFDKNDYVQPHDDLLNDNNNQNSYNNNNFYNNNQKNRNIKIIGSNENLVDSTNLIIARPELIDVTDPKHSFDSLNVGNIDRLALAGDSTTKSVADIANTKWELSLLGSGPEQCGPDRRRDSYGVCQFVPADYATATT